METVTFEVETGRREVVRDITGECSRFAGEAGGDGLLNVFVPHATAGIAILETEHGEDVDPGVHAGQDRQPPARPGRQVGGRRHSTLTGVRQQVVDRRHIGILGTFPHSPTGVRPAPTRSM